MAAIAAAFWLGCAAVLALAWLAGGFSCPGWHAEGLQKDFLAESFPLTSAAAMPQRAKTGSRALIAERTFVVSANELPALQRQLASFAHDPTLHATITVTEPAPGSEAKYHVHVRLLMRREDLGPWNNLGPHAFTFNNN